MLELKDFQPYEYASLVRRGSSNDGGYLLPSDISTELLISFGLGEDWKFELDLVKHKQVSKFIIFDHSVSLSSLFKKLFVKRRKLSAYIYRIIIIIRYSRDFSLSRNSHVKKKITREGSISNSENLNLVEIFNEFSILPKSNHILKIDIEGSEYKIIEQIVGLNSQIAILIIEFHNILDKKDVFKSSLDLLKLNFLLIHTHANNYGRIDNSLIPNVCEFTFINKSIYTTNKKVTMLPRLDLDSPCNSNLPDYEIIFSKEGRR